jgi:hypothetical protein
MVMLARLKSPTFIRDRLNAFLQPRARNYINVIDGGIIDGGVIDGRAGSGTDARAPLFDGGWADGGRAGRTDGRRVIPRLLLQVAKA